MRKILYVFVLMPLMAFGGGFCAQWLLQPTQSLAQQAGDANVTLASDAKNARGIQAYVQDGQPGFILYGEDGQMRMQMGTYAGAGERGMPLLGLSDTKGRLRLLFRMAGANESPVIIMKDTGGRDRMVMGLSLSDPAQAPFLSTVDENGQKKDIFGKY